MRVLLVSICSGGFILVVVISWAADNIVMFADLNNDDFGKKIIINFGNTKKEYKFSYSSSRKCYKFAFNVSSLSYISTASYCTIPSNKG